MTPKNVHYPLNLLLNEFSNIDISKTFLKYDINYVTSENQSYKALHFIWK